MKSSLLLFLSWPCVPVLITCPCNQVPALYSSSGTPLPCGPVWLAKSAQDFSSSEAGVSQRTAFRLDLLWLVHVEFELLRVSCLQNCIKKSNFWLLLKNGMIWELLVPFPFGTHPVEPSCCYIPPPLENHVLSIPNSPPASWSICFCDVLGPCGH